MRVVPVAVLLADRPVDLAARQLVRPTRVGNKPYAVVMHGGGLLAPVLERLFAAELLTEPPALELTGSRPTRFGEASRSAYRDESRREMQRHLSRR